MSQPPKKTIRLGKIELALWENTFNDFNGNPKLSYSVTLKKSFKDKKSDTWKDTKFFDSQDALNAIALLQKFVDGSIAEKSFTKKQEAPPVTRQTEPDSDPFADANVDNDEPVDFGKIANGG